MTPQSPIPQSEEWKFNLSISHSAHILSCPFLYPASQSIHPPRHLTCNTRRRLRHTARYSFQLIKPPLTTQSPPLCVTQSVDNRLPVQCNSRTLHTIHHSAVCTHNLTHLARIPSRDQDPIPSLSAPIVDHTSLIQGPPSDAQLHGGVHKPEELVPAETGAPRQSVPNPSFAAP